MSQYQTILLKTAEEINLKQLQRYVDTNLPTLANNPDIFVLSREKSSIGIVEVKSLISWIYKRPFQHEEKLGVIKNAESLTSEAQNSLLKTLEEPPIHTQLVLITNNTDTILPTIRSRSHIIELSLKYQEPTAEWSELAKEFYRGKYLERSKLIENLNKSKQKRIDVSKFIEALLKEALRNQKHIPNRNEVLSLLHNSLIASKQGTNVKPTLVNINITLGIKAVTS